MKLFKKYVDNIMCTVPGDPEEFLTFAISFHKNYNFPLKKLTRKGIWLFLIST